MNDESIHRRLVTREDSFLKVVSLAGVTADVIKFVTRALARNDDGTFFFKYISNFTRFAHMTCIQMLIGKRKQRHLLLKR